jgi:hypothetical protein
MKRFERACILRQLRSVCDTIGELAAGLNRHGKRNVCADRANSAQLPSGNEFADYAGSTTAAERWRRLGRTVMLTWSVVAEFVRIPTIGMTC